MFTLHDFFEVPSYATVSDVEKAWKKLIRRYHPDKCSNGAELSKAINRFYFDLKRILENNVRPEYNCNDPISEDELIWYHRLIVRDMHSKNIKTKNIADSESLEMTDCDQHRIMVLEIASDVDEDSVLTHEHRTFVLPNTEGDPFDDPSDVETEPCWEEDDNEMADYPTDIASEASVEESRFAGADAASDMRIYTPPLTFDGIAGEVEPEPAFTSEDDVNSVIQIADHAMDTEYDSRDTEANGNDTNPGNQESKYDQPSHPAHVLGEPAPDRRLFSADDDNTGDEIVDQTGDNGICVAAEKSNGISKNGINFDRKGTEAEYLVDEVHLETEPAHVNNENVPTETPDTVIHPNENDKIGLHGCMLRKRGFSARWLPNATDTTKPLRTSVPSYYQRFVELDRRELKLRSRVVPAPRLIA